MRRARKKTLVAAGAVTATVLAGGATVAAATAPSGSAAIPGTTAERADDDADEKDEARITGTLALADVATVTESAARDAAVAAVPGTAGQVSLDEEDGYIVWEVDVTGDDGTVTEVVVDAGDASLLAQEAEDSDD